MSGKNSYNSYVLFQRGFLVTGFEAKRINFSTCRKNNRCKILFIFTRKNKQLLVLGNLRKRTLNWDKLIVRLLGCDLPQI